MKNGFSFHFFIKIFGIFANSRKDHGAALAIILFKHWNSVKMSLRNFFYNNNYVLNYENYRDAIFNSITNPNASINTNNTNNFETQKRKYTI